MIKRAFVLLTFLAVAALAWAQDPPTVSIKLAAPAVKPGAAFDATVSVTFAENLHGYQNPPTEDFMIPVTVVSGSKEFTMKSAKYPKGVIKKAGGMDAAVYEGTVQIPVTLVAPKKAGAYTLKLDVKYQQCDENNCFVPGTASSTAKIKVDPKAAPPKKGDGKEEAPVAAATTGTPGPSTGTQPVNDSKLAQLFVENFKSGNYLVVLLISIAIGLLINLTPCVYPMVPVTLSFFSGQAGDNRSARIQLGLMYMVGIAVTYGLVGGLAAGLGATFGALFQAPWFNIALGVFMFVLALSMFDLYQIGLPPAFTKHLKGRSGPVGSLIMGLFVGVAAAPCAGPLIVPPFTVVAESRSLPLGLLVFTTIGLGIGFPYVILASAAAGAKTLPKAGGWMKTLKAVLGIVVAGFGLLYVLQGLGAGLDERARALIWIAFFVASAIYLIGFESSGLTKPILSIKGAAALVCGLMAGITYQAESERAKLAELQRAGAVAGIEWVKLTEDTYATAKSSGKPIFIDATADWCAECKATERNVFSQPNAIIALSKVQPMKIDWSTGVDPSYQDMTRKLFDIKGLPHFVFIKPGGEIALVKNHIGSPEDLIDGLRAAGAQL
ncbi:MAG: Thiol:disulfide interchange protein DsbD [Fimbriimonadaceae bacterium]|nr:Thiol:disulfide interchange protein DsbD [Fimbriimonadaceae bacterium]